MAFVAMEMVVEIPQTHQSGCESGFVDGPISIA
jgi:hypothetical protein